MTVLKYFYKNWPQLSTSHDSQLVQLGINSIIDKKVYIKKNDKTYEYHYS